MSVDKVKEDLLNEDLYIKFDRLESSSVEDSNLENPFRSRKGSTHPEVRKSDLEDFIELLEKVIADSLTREGIIEKAKVEFTGDFPQERIDRLGHLITWRLISRKPASIGTEKERTNKAFIHMDSISLPEFPGEAIEIEARLLDHVIELSCWDKSSRVANSMALWLERTLIDYTGFLQSNGIDRFYFQERLADNYMVVGKQSLYQRSLRFFVRLYEQRSKINSKLNVLDIQLELTGKE